MAEALRGGDEQVIVGAERVQQCRDEDGVEERRIDTRDEDRVGAIAEREQSGLDATQRSLLSHAIARQLHASG